MQIAILTFDGFNELDSLIALGILNRANSQHLAAWIIARSEGIAEAERAIHDVAPVGEKEAYVSRAMAHVTPFLANVAASLAA